MARAAILHRSSGRSREFACLSRTGSISRCKTTGCVRLGLCQFFSISPAAGEVSGAFCLFAMALNLLPLLSASSGKWPLFAMPWEQDYY